MVSLGSNRSFGNQAFVFGADGPSNSVDIDDCSLLTTSLVNDQEPRHKSYPVAGWIAVMAEFVFMNIMLVLIFLRFPCFLLCMVHVAMWFMFFVTYCIRHRCSGIMKRYGYLELYRKTRGLIKVPFIVSSFGNTAILVSFSMVASFCSIQAAAVACPKNSVMHCRYYVMIIYCLEYLVHLAVLIHYIAILGEFQRKKPLPDVQQDDLLISCIHSQTPTSEIGYREEDFKEEVLEKQADMIRYLRQHNIYLGRKIMKLSAELENFKTGDRT